jgi:hypothetical protein
MDTAKFISKAIRIHGSKFDYSDIVYSNCSDKLKIKCFAHGIFEQTSLSHLSGKGCPSCAPNARLTTETFISKANAVHKNKYEYDCSIYENSKKKLLIKCKKHGVFLQTPNDHLTGSGCAACKADTISKKLSSNSEIFISKSRLIHFQKYDYSKVSYSKCSYNLSRARGFSTKRKCSFVGFRMPILW